ncbi:FadR/GntR family transcriptional regulator [Marinospirillum alkaliphilum]|uniref:DNA-binding transcriptional regulator, FadR family n=1 Tax=Marinospirillum alkaliphilum DSM 21637 TaxID=1122209 RepID=A0A1K1XWZ9_9GAMM|nr:FCD domain-containing protein [Marinospirillum alkaliphilum]SFX54289.1 DNA-binding transcriptional regulator, FadR family [Marinospirillum alkaliphilum DSM 21637]
MSNPFYGLISPRKIKRSDQIVESVKRWVVVRDMQPGDRLPNEKELMELFQCSKGTVREALKSLEVQGLITLRTGPGGGAMLAQVPYPLASQLLRNYLHFQHPTGPDIYRLRKLVEPELAALVVDRLTEADLQQLEQLTEQCAQPPADLEQRLAQRIAELDFHSVLAERCPDPLLAFIGRFLNDLIKDLVIYKKVELPEQVDFSRENLFYHRELIKAFRAGDAAKVRQLMAEHMASAERFNVELEGQLSGSFLSSKEG